MRPCSAVLPLFLVAAPAAGLDVTARGAWQLSTDWTRHASVGLAASAPLGGGPVRATLAADWFPLSTSDWRETYNRARVLSAPPYDEMVSLRTALSAGLNWQFADGELCFRTTPLQLRASLGSVAGVGDTRVLYRPAQEAGAGFAARPATYLGTGWRLLYGLGGRIDVGLGRRVSLLLEVRHVRYLARVDWVSCSASADAGLQTSNRCVAGTRSVETLYEVHEGSTVVGTDTRWHGLTLVSAGASVSF